MSFKCYDNIIGLSQTDCECTATDRPVDYNVSKSGIYLDQLTNISKLMSLNECEKSFWDILEDAKKFTISKFVKDTNLLLGEKYKLKRQNVKEVVLGQIKAKDIITPTKNYGVVRFVCAPVRSGYVTIKKIGTIFDNVFEPEMMLYNNVDGFLQNILMSETLVNKHQADEVNITLPLHSKFVDQLEYYFVYEFEGGANPKKNKLNCGCGGWTPDFDLDNPYFNNIGSPKSAPWSDYVMLGGGQINSLSEVTEIDGLDETTFSKYLHGLTFEVGFNCKVDEVVCKDSLDFVGNPLALGVAFAILYGTGYEVANRLLKDDQMERYNLINGEEWEADQIEWMEKYNQHINYIAEEASIAGNDCLTCKDVIGMTRSGIFS